jgi:D-amino peptidase
MKILVMTDVEGCAGVMDFENWAMPEGRYYDESKRLLTEEVNAAVDGLSAGGAAEIVVVDGHGPGGIDPEILDERASFVRGGPEPRWPWTLDGSFDALAFVGQHAKAGTPFSHLTHTQSRRYVDLTVNGVSVGEYGQLALCAMELGVPTVLACGEEALAREAEALTPGVVTVSVKRGLLRDGLDHLGAAAYIKSKLSAVHVSPRRARKMIREGAERAASKLEADPSSFGYPDLSPPYVRAARFRATDETAPYQTRDEHPESIIALMNMPYTKIEKSA